MPSKIVLYLGHNTEKIMWRTIYFVGVLALSFAVLLVSCEKDNLITNVPHNLPVDSNWGKGEPDSLVAEFYFRGKIDSVLYTFQDSLGGYYNLAYDSGYIKCDDTNKVFYGQSFGMYTQTGLSSLDIKFLKCLSDTADQASIDSLLYLGAYPYGSSNLLNTVAGVEITWVDGSGKVWKTLPNSGNKVDDSFVIKSINLAPTDSIGNLVLFGTMNVHLYNSTEYITIEGGEFNLQYGVY
jgi:hypothetical protein